MRFLCALVLIALPGMAAAQTDKDFLTAYLEENLSSAGRVVTITGFSGALSTRATMAEMTIADDLGVWLRVKDVTLDWSQSALLSGQVIIDELSAGEIDLQRIPAGQAGGLPSPEARGFTVPNLPVSIDIQGIAAKRIVLGAAVLGQAVEGTLDAAMKLEAGNASVRLDLLRSDQGPDGHFVLRGDYLAETGALSVDLSAKEGPGGVAVALLGVPGAPSAEFTVQGSGPVENFVADISLKTDEVTRLAGKVQLTSGPEGRGFVADLAGDPTPVFVPRYAAFFGPDVALHAEGLRRGDGSMDLSAFQLSTKALSLAGKVELDPNLDPVAFGLTGYLGLPEGAVVLPLGTARDTKIAEADITLSFDKRVSADWQGSAVLNGLDHAALTAAQVELTGSGQIAPGESFAGKLGFGAGGVAFADRRLADALGDKLTGSLGLAWVAGGKLTLSDLLLNGAGYEIAGSGDIGGIEDQFALSGRVTGTYNDLSRLSGFAGYPLTGKARIEVSGTGSALNGFADVEAKLEADDLGLGVDKLDALLAGRASVALSVLRDGNGTLLRDISLQTPAFGAKAKGTISSKESKLTGSLDLPRLAVLGGGFGGALSGSASLTGPLDGFVLKIAADGRNLSVGQTQADILMAGKSQLQAEFGRQGDTLILRQLDIRNPQVSALAKGRADGALVLEQRIRDLGLLYPQFPGTLVATGTAIPDASGYAVDMVAKGPGQIDARIKGRIRADFGNADLAISGTASAGLANKLAEPRSLSGAVRYDLRMLGPIAVNSLSGPVAISGGKLADPAQKFGVTDIAGTATLAAGRARVEGRGAVSTGGAVVLSGTVGLATPYPGQLDVQLQEVVLKDPSLYRTRLNGNLTVNGPLTGNALIAGRVDLGKTELQIPSTGFGSDGNLPGLTHIREGEASRSTRARAEQANGRTAGSGVSSGYGLNVQVVADRQVFIRGRGLDAELGGRLTLRGTTDAIVPAGSFSLIRGRLDILGKRLNLSEALLQLEGALVPFVHVVASVQSDGITASVVIDGRVDDPVVSFTSSPALPQEEVLARLLFDRALESLTAFQALQLANAVATLAGQGGEGVVARLRKQWGLDNLDVQSDGTGDASVTVGKYISEKAYTEVTVDQGGKSAISLNLDLNANVTLKGTVDSDGQTGIGVFLQRDY